MLTIRGVMDASNGKMTMADGVGEFLRRERELRYISLDNLADRTKISRRYLEAIEEGQYDRLPGETFIRGFIRSYAQSVGLDPEETLLRYNQSRLVLGAPPVRTERPFLERRAWNERSLLWLLLAGVVVVGGMLVSFVGIVERPSLLRWPSSPRPDSSSPLTGGVPLILTVIADSDTWLRVTIDEQPAQDMVLRAGQSTQWIGRERFIVSIGNARATRLKLNDHGLTIPQPAQSALRQYTVSREMLP
jgi:transcriptional regulator with XRE-family HTH domain